MMSKRRSKTDIWNAATTTAQRLHGQDEVAATVAEKERHQRTKLPLGQIHSRLSDTRTLRETHVEQLAESIAVLGLLEPLVVDNQGRLLAGGHRKGAIEKLRQNHPDVYATHFPDELVPVRMMSFNAEEDPELALQVEVSENEKRRDYTPSEVRALAERLRESGYVDTPGRPSQNEKRLRPALEVIIGKSLRSVRRYLTEEKPVQLGQVSSQTALRQAKAALMKWEKLKANKRKTEAEKQLAAELSKFLELIDLAISPPKKK